MISRTVVSYIDGSWVEGGEPFPDVNPAHPEQSVADVQLADAAVARSAVVAASRAFDSWRATPPPKRGEVLRVAADILQKRQDTISLDFAIEEGKTVAEAAGEIGRAIAILRYFAGQTFDAEGDIYPSSSPVTLLYARREPVGVVVAITPFNFPMAIPAWKIAPALAYGNAVVWKPAEIVPLTSTHFMQALIDAGVPHGVLNMVLARGEDVGEELTTADAVDAISFTGSSTVGKIVQAHGIEHGKKVQLELGGKNPAIVLADADLDLAVEQVARGAFLSAGQKCTATSRVIVERPVLKDFAERLAHVAKTWKVGDPVDPQTVIGPVVSEEQMNKVLGYLDVADREGATILAGGGRDVDQGNGYFVQPTVLQGLKPESRVVREEIFGPVTAVLGASSYEEAVQLANDTPYGLAATLFTGDLGKALRFVRDVRAGVVKINQETAGLELQVPFGGMKQSSSGSREQGKVARDFYTQWKTVYIDPPTYAQG